MQVRFAGASRQSPACFDPSVLLSCLVYLYIAICVLINNASILFCYCIFVHVVSVTIIKYWGIYILFFFTIKGTHCTLYLLSLSKI